LPRRCGAAARAGDCRLSGGPGLWRSTGVVCCFRRWGLHQVGGWVFNLCHAGSFAH
jgi:hypothetical protein